VNPDDCNALNTETRFTPVLCARAAELLAGYDEHALSSTYKFGVVPQLRGQITEEQLFSNRDPSPAIVTFLDLLGSRVRLRDHKG
jgi:RAP1 GTPase activating protein 1